MCMIIFVGMLLLMVAMIHVSPCTKDQKYNLYILAMAVGIIVLSVFSRSVSKYMFLQGGVKEDGCCLFPDKEECKKYTEEDFARECCNKGYNGKKVRFDVQTDVIRGCNGCDCGCDK